MSEIMPPGFYNMDCMEAMKQFPDKFFDLSIVDPPYGDANDGNFWKRFGSKDSRFERYKRETQDASGEKRIEWDIAPGKEYFDELFRVSKNQIIWGGNYFPLPPTRCFLVWRKLTISDSFSMAMAEYAWTSFNSNAKVFECAPQGAKNDPRFHPTQKPVALYSWILDKFAKPGMKILDTHVGSGSSMVACHRAGFECWGFEIDPVYYSTAKERLDLEKAQVTMLDILNNK